MMSNFVQAPDTQGDGGYKPYRSPLERRILEGTDRFDLDNVEYGAEFMQAVAGKHRTHEKLHQLCQLFYPKFTKTSPIMDEVLQKCLATAATAIGIREGRVVTLQPWFNSNLDVTVRFSSQDYNRLTVYWKSTDGTGRKRAFGLSHAGNVDKDIWKTTTHHDKTFRGTIKEIVKDLQKHWSILANERKQGAQEETIKEIVKDLQKHWSILENERKQGAQEENPQDLFWSLEKRILSLEDHESLDLDGVVYSSEFMKTVTGFPHQTRANLDRLCQLFVQDYETPPQEISDVVLKRCLVSAATAIGVSTGKKVSLQSWFKSGFPDEGASVFFATDLDKKYLLVSWKSPDDTLLTRNWRFILTRAIPLDGHHWELEHNKKFFRGTIKEIVERLGAIQADEEKRPLNSELDSLDKHDQYELIGWAVQNTKGIGNLKQKRTFQKVVFGIEPGSVAVSETDIERALDLFTFETEKSLPLKIRLLLCCHRAHSEVTGADGSIYEWFTGKEVAQSVGYVRYSNGKDVMVNDGSFVRRLVTRLNKNGQIEWKLTSGDGATTEFKSLLEVHNAATERIRAKDFIFTTH
jgi:hypothetical protein